MILFLFILPIIAAGLVTMKSFVPTETTGDFFIDPALHIHRDAFFILEKL